MLRRLQEGEQLELTAGYLIVAWVVKAPVELLSAVGESSALRS